MKEDAHLQLTGQQLQQAHVETEKEQLQAEKFKLLKEKDTLIAEIQNLASNNEKLKDELNSIKTAQQRVAEEMAITKADKQSLLLEVADLKQQQDNCAQLLQQNLKKQEPEEAITALTKQLATIQETLLQREHTIELLEHNNKHAHSELATKEAQLQQANILLMQTLQERAALEDTNRMQEEKIRAAKEMEALQQQQQTITKLQADLVTYQQESQKKQDEFHKVKEQLKKQKEKRKKERHFLQKLKFSLTMQENQQEQRKVALLQQVALKDQEIQEVLKDMEDNINDITIPSILTGLHTTCPTYSHTSFPTR